MRRVWVVFCLCIFLSSGWVRAQSASFPLTCTPEGRAMLADALTTAAANVRANREVEASLMVIQASAATYLSQCAGLVFTNELYGLDRVTDPIAFPDGVYRMVLESNGLAEVELTPLQGECGDTYVYTSRDATHRESASRMIDCIAVLDIASEQPYTLTYQPILVRQTN